MNTTTNITTYLEAIHLDEYRTKRALEERMNGCNYLDLLSMFHNYANYRHNRRKLRVLSLFDGISIGQLALYQLGFDVEYHAFEIDKTAISITELNFPNTIQHGNIENINFEEFRGFDLLLCGSPCQDLSQCTKGRQGLDGMKSKLFFYGARAVELGICKYFLFENVGGMRAVDRQIMTECLGVQPHKMCSSLFSAQTRNRLYWTNIEFRVPTERYTHVIAQDMLDYGIAPRNTYTAVMTHPDSAGSLLHRMEKRRIQQFKCVIDNDGEYLHGSIPYGMRYYNLVPGVRFRLERLTAIELERLQTMPDDYTKYGHRDGKIVEIGYHARHHAIGNAWTTEAIKHILANLK